MTAVYFFTPPDLPRPWPGSAERSKKPRLPLHTVDRDALRSLQSEWALIYSLGSSFVARGGWWGPFRGGPWENGSAQRFFSTILPLPFLCHLFPIVGGSKEITRQDGKILAREHVCSLPVSARNVRSGFLHRGVLVTPWKSWRGRTVQLPSRKINRKLLEVSAKWDFFSQW